MKLYEALYDLQGQKADHAKAKVNEIFAKHDRDRSGALNKAEFILALSQDNIFSFF